MRAQRPQDRVSAGWAWALFPALGTGAGLLVGSFSGALVGAACGALLAWASNRRFVRRAARRRAALAAPFPEKWRELLLEGYDHFHRLPEDLRRRFEEDVTLFLLEKPVTGVGVAVTDELRLLVAASAVTLSLGWPEYEWDQLSEVLLYPDEFDRDFNVEGRGPAPLDDEGRPQEAQFVGLAHHSSVVILSVPALRQSFDDPDDAFHVGLHEFAHLLDTDPAHASGLPVGLGGQKLRAWVEVAERERQRLLREEERPASRRGRRAPQDESVFDPYGAENPAEFLGVAVEAFFEASLAVRRTHPELYALLAAYFAQDPAAWDDARGLVLE